MRCMWSQTYRRGADPCTKAATRATLTATGHVVAALCAAHTSALNKSRKRAGLGPVRYAKLLQENPNA